MAKWASLALVVFAAGASALYLAVVRLLRAGSGLALERYELRRGLDLSALPASALSAKLPKRLSARNRGSVTRLVNLLNGGPCDVNIGRGPRHSRPEDYPWANEWSHMSGTLAKYRVRTREEAVAAYVDWLPTQPHLWSYDALSGLYGKTLGCWCVPRLCHGHTLVYLADASRTRCRCGSIQLACILFPGSNCSVQHQLPGASPQRRLL